MCVCVGVCVLVTRKNWGSPNLSTPGMRFTCGQGPGGGETVYPLENLQNYILLGLAYDASQL